MARRAPSGTLADPPLEFPHPPTESTCPFTYLQEYLSGDAGKLWRAAQGEGRYTRLTTFRCHVTVQVPNEDGVYVLKEQEVSAAWPYRRGCSAVCDAVNLGPLRRVRALSSVTQTFLLLAVFGAWPLAGQQPQLLTLSSQRPQLPLLLPVHSRCAFFGALHPQVVMFDVSRDVIKAVPKINLDTPVETGLPSAALQATVIKQVRREDWLLSNEMERDAAGDWCSVALAPCTLCGLQGTYMSRICSRRCHSAGTETVPLQFCSDGTGALR